MPVVASELTTSALDGLMPIALAAASLAHQNRVIHSARSAPGIDPGAIVLPA